MYNKTTNIFTLKGRLIRQLIFHQKKNITIERIRKFSFIDHDLLHSLTVLIVFHVFYVTYARNVPSHTLRSHSFAPGGWKNLFIFKRSRQTRENSATEIRKLGGNGTLRRREEKFLKIIFKWRGVRQEVIMTLSVCFSHLTHPSQTVK